MKSFIVKAAAVVALSVYLYLCITEPALMNKSFNVLVEVLRTIGQGLVDLFGSRGSN